MKKINRKGFMLAEVIIVASVVATVLVSIYISLTRISNAYQTRNTYYDIDAMYVAMDINNLLVKNNDINNYGGSNFVDLYNNSGDNDILSYFRQYDWTGYTVNFATYAKATSENINDLYGLIHEEDYQIKDYIGYIKENIQYDDYQYLIIIALQKKSDDETLYFYTLKVEE